MENEKIYKTVTKEQAGTISMLFNLLKQQSTPVMDLDVFDGNLPEYPNL